MDGIFYPFTNCSLLLPITTISTNICLGTSLGTTAAQRGYTAAQLYNQSTNDAYVHITASSGTTQSSLSTGPYPSTFSCGVAVPFHQQVVVGIPALCWVSGLTTAAALSASVLITPGKLT